MAKPLSDEMLRKIYNEEWVPCSAFHDKSCEWDACRKFMVAFNMAYKFYIPIHGLPTLIYKRKRLTKEPLKITKDFVYKVFCSSLFIACYISSFWYMMCRFKNWRRRTDKINVVISATLCTFAIFWETKSRRTELALYIFPRFLESLFLFLVKHGYLRTIKNGEVLIFAVAMSIIMYVYQNEPRNIKSSYLSMFKRFFGDN